MFEPTYRSPVLRPVAPHDAAQLHADRGATSRLSVRLLELERSADGAMTLAALRDHLEARAWAVPALRDGARRVPLSLGHPVWEEVGPPDVTRLVRTATVAAPGDEAAVRATVARLATAPLEPTGWLWDALLLEGHAEDADLVLLRMHHALADGNAAANVLVALLGEAPSGEPAHPPASRVADRALVLHGVRRSLRALRRLPELARRSATRRRVAAELAEAGDPPAATAYGGPDVPWARRLPPERSWARTTLSLDAIDEVRAGTGATVTATACAVVGAALRDELIALAQLPTRALTATVTIGDPGSDPGRMRGNASWVLFTSLHTDELDPRRRLELIAADLRTAVRRSRALDEDVWTLWWELYPLQRAGHLLADAVMRLLHRPVAALIVSTVRGPDATLALAGRRVTGLWSTGPIVDMLGLNVTAWSLGRDLHVSLLSAPGLADVDRLAERLPRALNELAGL